MNRSKAIAVAVLFGAWITGTNPASVTPPSVAAVTTPSTAATLEGAAATTVCLRDRVLVIGHRGTGPGTRTLYGVARSEDTLPAFQAAMRAGADGFETDFWPTADNHVVSHHDSTLTRMTNGTGAIRRRSAGYVEGVRNVSGAPVPTFHQVLAAMVSRHPGLHVQQEFKDGRMFSDAVLTRLANYDRAFLGDVGSRVLFTASQLGTLRRFQRIAPDIPIGLIDRSSGRPRLSTVPSWVDVILIEFGAADATYVRRAMERGHEVSLREVNSVARMEEAVRMGATRVVTDRPEILGRSC